MERSLSEWIGVHGTPYVFAALLLAGIAPAAGGDSYDLAFSTYFGGTSWEHARDVAVDAQGSIYVVGGAASADFPTTPGVYSPTIHVDPGRTYQTISGWEVVAFALDPANPAYPKFKDSLFDLAVNDAGITRVRLEIRSGVENTEDNWSASQSGAIDYATWRSRRYATVNDNADPCTIEWSGFHFSELDNTIERIVNPLRQAMAARGETLCVNVNYVAFTDQIQGGAYMHDNAAEYAEFVLATYLHMQQKYGWVPDLWEPILEPDNVPQWNGKLIGEAIVATAERLRAAGFEPAFVAPSNTNMGNAVSYFDQMIAVPGVLPVLRELSYHRYGGVSLANLTAIAARGNQYGIGTAMLEWWSNSNGYATLHEDLKVGNNCAWEQGVLGGAMNSEMSLYKIDDSNPANPLVLMTDKTKFLRQYYKFVRPGAIRIDAVSQDAAFDPLAFINADGRYVVVVKCNAGGNFSVGRLPAGTYGVKYTTASEYDVDLPDLTIQAGQAVSAQIPQAGVLTVYGKPQPEDELGPAAPTQLVIDDLMSFRLTLAWTASTDAALAGYRVYRDGIQLGFATTPAFADSQVQAGATYVYEVTAYDTAGNESPRSAPLTVTVPQPSMDSQLLGRWEFDEPGGITAMDSSGYSHHGTIFQALRVPGKTGQALDFKGFGHYVQIVPAPVLDTMDEVTMTAWIYPRVDAHWHVLDKGDGDKRLYAEGIHRTLDGRVRYTGVHAVSQSVSNTLQLNAWQHVALTWSRQTNTTRLYHNGVEVQYSSREIGTGVPLEDADFPYTIGARGALGVETFFNGLIDEVRLYRRALTPQEIADLCGVVPPPDVPPPPPEVPPRRR